MFLLFGNRHFQAFHFYGTTLCEPPSLSLSLAFVLPLFPFEINTQTQDTRHRHNEYQTIVDENRLNVSFCFFVLCFFCDNQDLPKLPVPELEETMTEYLRALEPTLTQQQHDRVTTIVKQFESPSGLGPKLHQFLVEKRDAEDNWVIQTWFYFQFHLAVLEPLHFSINVLFILPFIFLSFYLAFSHQSRLPNASSKACKLNFLHILMGTSVWRENYLPKRIYHYAHSLR